MIAIGRVVKWLREFSCRLIPCQGEYLISYSFHPKPGEQEVWRTDTVQYTEQQANRRVALIRELWDPGRLRIKVTHNGETTEW